MDTRQIGIGQGCNKCQTLHLLIYLLKLSIMLIVRSIEVSEKADNQSEAKVVILKRKAFLGGGGVQCMQYLFPQYFNSTILLITNYCDLVSIICFQTVDLRLSIELFILLVKLIFFVSQE